MRVGAFALGHADVPSGLSSERQAAITGHAMAASLDAAVWPRLVSPAVRPAAIRAPYCCVHGHVV